MSCAGPSCIDCNKCIYTCETTVARPPVSCARHTHRRIDREPLRDLTSTPICLRRELLCCLIQYIAQACKLPPLGGKRCLYRSKLHMQHGCHCSVVCIERLASKAALVAAAKMVVVVVVVTMASFDGTVRIQVVVPVLWLGNIWEPGQFVVGVRTRG